MEELLPMDLATEQLVYHHVVSLALEVLSIAHFVVVPIVNIIKPNTCSISFPNE
jgi:hypothetical protein